ncbi:hypothetical protein COV24_04315 [candidate division WWE3 bacterium CG10_big_fil_rev_8_21_14_0_10_32_10]|uniref:Cell division protein FtsX n=1 Tax=candidate division WWE3 bacterium CG10_big_fil_rev_8_21_14_0_10_32_10 TaxID=1975090 RepID=A0A2H0R9F7_UNCKA|nr:MAG: hypothetical protein COV24_04315 [candidate division WWE3 bacterium CG10_big_fil_rev_8_21_14_0_10_32_10]
MFRSLNVAKSNIKMQSILTFVSILTNTLTFFILSCFLAFALLSNYLLGFLESRAQLTVYFLDSASEQSILDLRKELLDMPQVTEVKYTSKEEAYKIFLNIFESQPLLTESADAAKLPASLDIWVKDINNMDIVSDFLKNKDGIEEIKYFKDALQTFKKWSTGIKYVGLILISIMLVQSFLTILIVTGVSIRDMSEEIKVTKLLGATNGYVQGPFFAQGFIISFISSLFSVVLFMSVVPFAEPFIRQSFSGVPIPTFSFLTLALLFGAQFVVNLFLSLSGTFVAVKKYLNF